MAKIRNLGYILTIITLGVLCALFLILYANNSYGFIKENKNLVISLGLTVIFVFIITSFVLCNKKQSLKRLTICFLALLCAILILLHIFNLSGFWANFESVESLKEFVLNKGVYSKLILFVIQFLQVIILPVPSIITIGASVALFGIFKGALLSFTAIFLGSITAFFIGRKLGNKVVGFIIGEKNLQRAQKSFCGKDKPFITMMFLMPFFPDDLLCFMSGLSNLSVKYFVIMSFFTRLISVFTTSYFLNGSLIPFDTVWGVSVWSIIFLFIALISLYIFKYGDKLNLKNIKNFLKS